MHVYEQGSQVMVTKVKEGGVLSKLALRRKSVRHATYYTYDSSSGILEVYFNEGRKEKHWIIRKSPSHPDDLASLKKSLVDLKVKRGYTVQLAFVEAFEPAALREDTIFVSQNGDGVQVKSKNTGKTVIAFTFASNQRSDAEHTLKVFAKEDDEGKHWLLRRAQLLNAIWTDLRCMEKKLIELGVPQCFHVSVSGWFSTSDLVMVSVSGGKVSIKTHGQSKTAFGFVSVYEGGKLDALVVYTKKGDYNTFWTMKKSKKVNRIQDLADLEKKLKQLHVPKIE